MPENTPHGLRLITWNPRTDDGERLLDIVEILHELEFLKEDIRRLAADYLAARFPRVNCTVSRANLEEFLYQTPIVQPPNADDGDDRAGL